MLLELRIESLLVIERAELRFGEGLNAITGETGAGKTVLAHALDLLMGGRARPQIVRPGAPEAYVEGVFTMSDGLLDAPELGDVAARVPDGAEELVLGRRVGRSGRTSAFIQGRSASAPELQALAARLLAFYGQHEHRKLTLASAQLEVLDGFAGSAQRERRARHAAAYATEAALRRELDRLREREGTRERDLDLLRFELAEIEATAPDPAEEAELEAERDRLRHAEGLRRAAATMVAALAGDDDADGGASGRLATAAAAMAGAAGIDRPLDELAERLRALGVELEDAARDARAYLDGIEADPRRLEALEERLGALDHLKRKHGGTVEAVLEHAERCRTEIARLENAEEAAAELQARLATAAGSRAELARELGTARRRAARGLRKRVEAELAQLAMEGATLDVRIEPRPDGPGPSGSERVELLVATNPGLPASPLREAASGGELSRVMLALTGAADGGGAPTLVFDEIDAGIGGGTARTVGQRLRRLARSAQVICITHLPQVASQAQTHFTIAKSVGDDGTTATVEQVDGEALVAEIVRMLGGERGDDAAHRHARELLAAA